MHAWISMAVPHITWYGPLDHWAQLCRALARARVLSLHISQMSWEPLRLPCGRNLSWCRSRRLGGGSHQPPFLNWAVGSWKPISCFLACYCTFILATSLEHPDSEWETQATRWVRSSSFWHIPWPTPWAIWPGLAFKMCSVWVNPSWLLSGWGGARPGCGALGSCGLLPVILHPWQGPLGSYSMACGWGCRWPLSITSFIGGTFRPFKEA